MSSNVRECDKVSEPAATAVETAKYEKQADTNDPQREMDESDDAVVTLDEVLNEAAALDADVAAVLGAEDDSICTYAQGYRKRQPLYACLTCGGDGEGKRRNGVCLGCSLQCHDGHEMVELYTKRLFRCDCGNRNFPGSFACTLNSEKETGNSGNSYNQNFDGVYCICHRPYPDPDDRVEDEMVQCCVCEDWFHTRHLNGKLTGDSVLKSPFVFEEVACSQCSQQLSFLKRFVSPSSDGSANTEKLCISATDGSYSQKEENSAESAVFLPTGWRQRLCDCSKCLTVYQEHKCDWLLDSEDSVWHYESLANRNAANEDANGGQQSDPLSAGIDAFMGKLGRVQQVELIHGYNSLKDELGGFLKRFAEEKTVVTERDVLGFFDEMQAKRRRTNDDGDGVPPSTCR